MNRARSHRLIILLTLLLTCVLMPVQGKTISPKTVLARMLKQHETIRSYQAAGVMRTTRIYGSVVSKDEVAFRLSFSRPRYFLLECLNTRGNQSPFYIMASDGKQNRLYLDGEGVKNIHSLGNGLVIASARSYGAPYTVANLLLKESFTKISLAKMKNLHFVGGEKIDEGESYILAGAVEANPKIWYKFWINKNDFTLRRIEKTTELANVIIIHEELYENIKININLPASIFNLKPPASSNKQTTAVVYDADGASTAF